MRNTGQKAGYAWLVRLIRVLEDAAPYVTEEMIAAAAARRAPDLDATALRALLDQAVRDGTLFRDARTRYERETDSFHDTHLYRVNRRLRAAPGGPRA